MKLSEYMYIMKVLERLNLEDKYANLEIKEKLKEFFVNNLGVDESELEFDTMLFGDGIGLDSIDSLEIIAGIDQEFGVQMTGVARENFFNIAALSKYVMEHLED